MLKAISIRKLLSLFLLLSYANLFSATGIYFFSGKAEVVEKGKASREVTTINETLGETASLRLAENAEVILRDASGQFAGIHKAGEFTSAQIKEQFKLQQGKGLVASLAGFLGSQFTSKHEDIRKMSESYMIQKGEVTRTGTMFPLMIWPPYGSVYDTNQVRFAWNAVPGVKRYEFVVFGSEDANNPVQLSKTLESDTFMDVNFSDFGKEKDAFFS